MRYTPAIKSAKRKAQFAVGKHTAILFGDIVPEGKVEYLYIMAVFDPNGQPCYFVASEVNKLEKESGKGSHFLGLFGDVLMHVNLGASDDWADESKFTAEALRIIRAKFGAEVAHPEPLGAAMLSAFETRQNFGLPVTGGGGGQIGLFLLPECHGDDQHLDFCPQCAAETVEAGAREYYTIIGIGTILFGRSGTCPRCGSFIRRLFWCVLFIPIVPLARFRFIQCRDGSYISRRLGTSYRSSDAQPMLDFAAQLEDIDSAHAVAKYEEIIRLFPGSAASDEARRNIQTLTPYLRERKPGYHIYLHPAVRVGLPVACAWYLYAGMKLMARTGEYFEMHPEVRGHDSPFDEECYARDAMAEFWAVKKSREECADPYLDLLIRIRSAGFIREYVWRFLREGAWDEPSGLHFEDFGKWAAENDMGQHEALTLAFIAPDYLDIPGAKRL